MADSSQNKEKFPEYRLYVFMKTTLASATPGRMAAQANHAGSYFNNAFLAGEKATDNKYLQARFKDWSEQTDQYFGTTIVLNGGDLKKLDRIMGEFPFTRPYFYAKIIDPTYRVMDGEEELYIPVNTCDILFSAVEDYDKMNSSSPCLYLEREFELL